MPPFLDAKFAFHSVGQGCFYSGTLSISSSSLTNFTFVYDCGTNSSKHYLNNEVLKFKSSIKNSLDLLIISHFDADHINGVFDLLSGITCKKVIIPYYAPLERLLLYTTTEEELDDYRLFIQNPINFLSNDNRFGIEEIIVVGGPDRHHEHKPIELEDTPPSDEDLIEELDNIDNFPFNADTESFDDQSFIGGLILNSEFPDTDYSKVKLLKYPYKINLRFWEFFFYLKKHSNYVLLKKFNDDVSHLLATKRIELRNLFDDDECINELRSYYKKNYSGNLNSTSLITYHGPLPTIQNLLLWFPFPDNKCGTLLTGDISINSKKAAGDLIGYFHSYLQKVSVFQVPHHGAKANWPKTLPSELNSFPTYVINHGIGRTHHPASKVIDDIKFKCKSGTIRLNNEAQNFSYSYRCFIKPFTISKKKKQNKPLEEEV